MADRITLTGLQVRGTHGVLEQERRDGQRFLVDVTVWLDVGPAARSDQLDQALDYTRLAELVVGIVSGPPRRLIETVAAEIADTVMGRFAVQAAEITVHKPDAPILATFADVSVTVRRSTKSGRTAI